MRVVFVQKFVPHYRLPFFERVRNSLAANGIEFILLYCEPDPYENSKVQMVQPDWGAQLKTQHFKLLGRYLYWAGVKKYLNKGDLVVVEHAAKLIDNYVIFALRQLNWLQMGYFGHGQNFQATTELRISAFLKRLMLRRVDHWFAYTEMSRQSLLRQSVDKNTITVVNNTLVKAQYADLGQKSPEPFSCIFIGGLYGLKLLPLLLESAVRIAKEIPEFTLHIVGEGPDKNIVEKYAQQHQWLHVHGSLYAKERDSLLARSNAILMPGLVGLIAIDSFQFQRPIITSDAGEHSPEYAYLEHTKNCLIDKGADGRVSTQSYSKLVVQYLKDTNLQSTLRQGCSSSAQLYSIDNMAASFVDAIVARKN